MPRVLFVFLDGVGVGPRDPEINPFLRAELPVLRDLLSGDVPTLHRPDLTTPRGRSFALDACFGVEGLPQSGTGQIALLTGVEAPRVLGRHFGPWPPVRLLPVLERQSIFQAARSMGASISFANAYPSDYPGNRPHRRLGAPPLAARAAGVLDRHHRELIRGEAVASEILNDGWIEHLRHRDVPRITAPDAGRNLARIAAESDFTLFAHYLTDSAGHRGGMDGATEALERVDRFLGGIIDRLPDDVLMLVASDHGNLEDVRGGHTRNPALGLAIGAGASRIVPPESIAGMSSLILSHLRE